MKGRKPKPTKLKLVTGNPGKRKLNDSEPVSELIKPEPPEYLSREAREGWSLMSEELFHSGILTRLDVPALEVLCVFYGRWRKAEELIKKAAASGSNGGLTAISQKGLVIQNPMIGIANRASEMLMKCLVEFGMTPSARSRIKTSGAREVDPTEKYFKKKA